MIQAIWRWQRENRNQRVLYPWRVGPDFEALFNTVLGSSSLVSVAQKDGQRHSFIKRGMFRGSGFTEGAVDTANIEASNLILMMKRIAVATPDIHQRVIAAAARATNTMPAFALSVRSND